MNSPIDFTSAPLCAANLCIPLMPVYTSPTNDIMYNYIIDTKIINSVVEKIFTIGVKLISLFIGK